MASIFTGASVTVLVDGNETSGTVAWLNSTHMLLTHEEASTPTLVRYGVGTGTVVRTDGSSVPAQTDGTSAAVYGVTAATVRAWCASEGMTVNPRGRLAPSVYAAYEARAV